jgi:hypothetical protein
MDNRKFEGIYLRGVIRKVREKAKEQEKEDDNKGNR